MGDDIPQVCRIELAAIDEAAIELGRHEPVAPALTAA
jgi:hypothetical protein